MVDTVARHDPGYRQLLPPSPVNEYAAMPSFHVGWNLLVGIVVFSATRNPLLRALALLAPAAMMVSAVVTANHFILDVVAGGAIVRRRSSWVAEAPLDMSRRPAGRVAGLYGRRPRLLPSTMAA